MEAQRQNNSHDLKLIRITPGHYQVEGITHLACGGDLRIERCGSGLFRWESFCTKCQLCDNNGWPTLSEALQEVQAFFNEPA